MFLFLFILICFLVCLFLCYFLFNLLAGYLQWCLYKYFHKFKVDATSLHQHLHVNQIVCLLQSSLSRLWYLPYFALRYHSVSKALTAYLAPISVKLDLMTWSDKLILVPYRALHILRDADLNENRSSISASVLPMTPTLTKPPTPPPPTTIVILNCGHLVTLSVKLQSNNDIWKLIGTTCRCKVKIEYFSVIDSQRLLKLQERLTATTSSNFITSHDRCQISFNNFTSKSLVAITTCGHVFEAESLIHWYNLNNHQSQGLCVSCKQFGFLGPIVQIITTSKYILSNQHQHHSGLTFKLPCFEYLSNRIDQSDNNKQKQRLNFNILKLFDDLVAFWIQLHLPMI